MKSIVRAALLAAALAAPAHTEETGLAGALQALRAGDYARAAELAAAVPADAPERPKASYVAGEAELVLGDPAAAAGAFREVLGARPEAVPALVGLGRALVRTGDAEGARGVLERALALAPGDRPARRARAELLVALGELPAARAELLAVFEDDPADPESARALVLALVRLDAAPDAERVASDFGAARPDHPMGWFLLGIAREKLAREEDAIAAYRRAIELDPLFLDAHKNLAILCHTLSNTYALVERNELAMRHYARYFELGGKDAALRATYEQLQQYIGPDGRVRQPAGNG